MWLRCGNWSNEDYPRPPLVIEKTDCDGKNEYFEDLTKESLLESV